MKKVVLSVVAALALTATVPALAADMPVEGRTGRTGRRTVTVGRCIRRRVHFRLRSARRIAIESQACGAGLFRGRLHRHRLAQALCRRLGIEPVDRLCRCGVRYHGRRAVHLGQLRPRSRVIYYYYPGGGITWPLASSTATGSKVYAKPSYKFTDWLTVGGVFETAFNNFNDKVSSLGRLGGQCRSLLRLRQRGHHPAVAPGA